MSVTIARVRVLLYFGIRPQRLLALIGAIFGSLLYVWFASVRAVPGVHGRKADARRAWRVRERKRP
jgi:nicotinamide riboside transporter PnuC